MSGREVIAPRGERGLGGGSGGGVAKVRAGRIESNLATIWQEVKAGATTLAVGSISSAPISRDV